MPRRTHRIRPASAGASLAAIGAACVVLAACSSSVDGKGTLSDPQSPATSTSRTTPTNTRSSSPDFPSTSGATTSTRTSSPTGTSSPTSTRTNGDEAALKSSLAELGANWMHAYANSDETLFCSLSDPATLQDVFDQKDIADCSELDINWDSDPDLQSQIAAFTIPDPSKISVSGSKATVSASNVRPSGLTSMGWVKQGDGSWKVDASILSE